MNKLFFVFVYFCVLAYITHHVVGDGCKQKDGDHAVGEQISKKLGQEVDWSPVVATWVLMAVDQT